MSLGVVSRILDQHVEDAAFLWHLRCAAVDSRSYSLSELADLDLRCEAHLDGLVIAGQPGLARAIEEFEGNAEPAEAFVAAVVSMRLQSTSGISVLLDAPLSSVYWGIVSAMSWLPWNVVSSVAHAGIESERDGRRLFAIAAFGAHRVDPGSVLLDLVEDENTLLAAIAIRLAGDLRRVDCLHAVLRCLESYDEGVRYWAARSALLLGDPSAIEHLKMHVSFGSAYADEAMRLFPRWMPASDALNWLRGLAQNEETRRSAIVGCGVAGNPSLIPALIGQMTDSRFSRVAGEAFELITGVDLSNSNMESDVPEGFSESPSESPADHHVDLDKDDDLAWPDPDAVGAWWNANSGRFSGASRYLCGRAIDEPHCQWILRNGNQRHRRAAAYELALLAPQEVLLDCSAPGFRQLQSHRDA